MAGKLKGRLMRVKDVKNKKFKTKISKKVAVKTSNIRGKINQIHNAPILPVSKWATLPFFLRIASLSCGVDTANAYVFSANSLFLPTPAGATHQPMGFDQLMLWYEHFTVSKCVCTVNFTNFSTTNPMIVGLMVAPDTTVITSIEALNENGLLSKKILNPQPGGGSCSVEIEVDIAKLNGIKTVVGEDIFRGSSAIGPTEQSYIHVFCYHPGASAVAITFEAYLSYTAKFTEPRKMPQS